MESIITRTPAATKLKSEDLRRIYNEAVGVIQTISTKHYVTVRRTNGCQMYCYRDRTRECDSTCTMFALLISKDDEHMDAVCNSVGYGADNCKSVRIGMITVPNATNIKEKVDGADTN